MNKQYKTNLPLETIILLDRIQKSLSIPDDAIKQLKKSKLIDGRKPNFFISEIISKHTNQIDQYIKNRGLDQEYYKKLILELVARKVDGCNRNDISNLLSNKLPDILTQQQKINKIDGLIRNLRLNGQITNIGSKKNSIWIIANTN